ncbi:PAS sensor protein [Streptomyces sp. Ru62]|uniref:SpoIIE family protein phosphatase n=1 Tax=Streptomyces sp. Ru62 TaxID=2080745 RepID=UPI000CDDA85C|nr:SpoIIE family protein phosphatase [Streptomyces sp. Ru62]POX62051.1 PAS sensor protein [Streptomyces sp. Ru62]
MSDTAAGPRSPGSGPDAVDSVLDHCARKTGAYAGAVYVLSPDGQVLQLAVLSGISRRIASPWARVPLPAASPVSDAVRQGVLVWIGSQQELARRYPQLALVLPHPFALVAAPISTGARTWGGLVLHWSSAHPPTLGTQERAVIADACRRLGPILRQAVDSGCVLAGPEPRILSPARNRAAGPAEAQAAADFAERLPSGCCALDPDGRITFLTTAAAELLGAGIPDLLGARPWEALAWLDNPVAEDRYRAAVLSRRPTSFTARRPPDQWLSFHLYPDASGISVRIVPTSSADAAVLPPHLLHPAPPADPGRATALYHLMHLAATLTEAVGVQDVVERVADQILPAFGAQALALMAAAEGRLRIIGYHGYSAALMDRFDAAPLTSDTPAVHVLTTGIPSFFGTFDDLRTAYPPAVLQDDMAAWAFLPLITSGRPVGSLVLAYDRPRAFPAEERSVLTSTAGLIAQALDRARLYDATQQLAHDLQAGLLPRTLPRVPGLDVAARYLPASYGMDVGGDFYDLIRLDGAAAAAAIGDVQGHNVQAATLMGQVRTAVHASAGAPPGEVLARTNRLLTDLDAGLFTSCLYADLDLARHSACLATAGHPPPILRHPDGHPEIVELPPGLLLGIDPAADYPTANVPLLPGAVLALYTDGLVEAPGTDIEEAITALADRLAHAGDQPMDALAGTLITRAQHTAPRSDDVALLLISPRRDV